MKVASAAGLVVVLGAAAVAAVVMVGGSHRASSAEMTLSPERSSAKSSPTPSASERTKRDPALDTIVAQLHRRFSDRQNVDFGFSRIMRPKVRVHAGPTADINGLVWAKDESEENTTVYFDPKLVRKKGDEYQLRREDGTWVPVYEARPMMMPENASERTALSTLNKAGRQIGIYTFGRWNGSRFLRGRGPAYINQLGLPMPAALELEGVAEKMWHGETIDLPGVRLRKEEIVAEQHCLSCHNDNAQQMDEMGPDGKELARPAKLKVGDRLGEVILYEILDGKARPPKVEKGNETVGFPVWG